MSKGPRQPNVHWYRKDLEANGFAKEFAGDGWEIMAVFIHPKTMRALMALYDGLIQEERFKAISAEHPVELTLRKGDEEKTLLASYNEVHTCPPEVC